MEINQFDFLPFVRAPKMRINMDFWKEQNTTENILILTFCWVNRAYSAAINNVAFDFAATKEPFRQMLV